MADLTKHVLADLRADLKIPGAQVFVSLHTLSSANKLEKVTESAVTSCGSASSASMRVLFHEAEKYIYDHISYVLFGERKLSTLYVVVQVRQRSPGSRPFVFAAGGGLSWIVSRRACATACTVSGPHGCVVPGRACPPRRVRGGDRCGSTAVRRVAGVPRGASPRDAAASRPGIAAAV